MEGEGERRHQKPGTPREATWCRRRPRACFLVLALVGCAYRARCPRNLPQHVRLRRPQPLPALPLTIADPLPLGPEQLRHQVHCPKTHQGWWTPLQLGCHVLALGLPFSSTLSPKWEALDAALGAQCGCPEVVCGAEWAGRWVAGSPLRTRPLPWPYDGPRAWGSHEDRTKPPGLQLLLSLGSKPPLSSCVEMSGAGRGLAGTGSPPPPAGRPQEWKELGGEHRGCDQGHPDGLREAH